MWRNLIICSARGEGHASRSSSSNRRFQIRRLRHGEAKEADTLQGRVFGELFHNKLSRSGNSEDSVCEKEREKIYADDKSLNRRYKVQNRSRQLDDVANVAKRFTKRVSGK